MAVEDNAIRYATGYVIQQLKRKYDKEFITISQCLLSMQEDRTNEESANDHEEEEKFYDYTKAWLDLVNRGGLFKVAEEVFKFFLELELCMYPILRKRLQSATEQDQSS